MTLEVQDYRARVARLLKTRGYMVAGSRYVTRWSVAKVLRGEASRVRGGSDHAHAVSGWSAKSTNTRLRIGCHIFTGENFRRIRAWALTEAR